MKIAGTIIDIESQYPAAQPYSRKKTNSTEIPAARNSLASHTTQFLASPLPDGLEISRAAMTTVQQEKIPAAKSGSSETPGIEHPGNDNLKIEILKNILWLVSGKDYDLYASQPPLNSNATIDKLKSLINQAQISIKKSQSPSKQEPGLEILAMETHPEDGQLSVAAGGIVQTAAGQTYDFDIRFNLDQEFARQNHINIPAATKVIDFHW
jgi:hypothetical protein